jgi:hypothetical protein
MSERVTGITGGPRVVAAFEGMNPIVPCRHAGREGSNFDFGNIVHSFASCPNKSGRFESVVVLSCPIIATHFQVVSVGRKAKKVQNVFIFWSPESTEK